MTYDQLTCEMLCEQYSVRQYVRLLCDKMRLLHDNSSTTDAVVVLDIIQLTLLCSADYLF